MMTKMDMNSNYVKQKAFINFEQHRFKTNQIKNSKNDKRNLKNRTILGSKTPRNDIYPLN